MCLGSGVELSSVMSSVSSKEVTIVEDVIIIMLPLALGTKVVMTPLLEPLGPPGGDILV